MPRQAQFSFFEWPVQMKDRLKDAYKDAEVEVMDLTGGGDHYQVTVISEQFQGLART
jgi:stress-induced morphogen